MLEGSMPDKDIQPVNQPLKQPSDRDSSDPIQAPSPGDVEKLFTRDTAAPAPG